jgi:voltage-gated potassium channel
MADDAGDAEGDEQRRDEVAEGLVAHEAAREAARTLPVAWGRGHGLTRHERRVILARTIARVVGTIVVLTVGYAVIPFDGSERWTVATVTILGLAVIATVAVVQIREISYAALPSVKAAETLSLLIPLVIIWFAAAYYAQSASSPGSFDEQLDHVGALYFSMTTITTIGYGDITPVSDTARMMVMVQMVTNVLVVGLAVRLTMSAVRNNLQATQEELAAREAHRQRRRDERRRRTARRQRSERNDRDDRTAGGGAPTSGGASS